MFQLFIFILTLAVVKGTTILSKDIKIDTILKRTLSPYNIEKSDLTVERGVTLTVESGVTIIMCEHCSLFIEGFVRFKGTRERKILITTIKVGEYRNFWNSIILYGTNHTIRNVIFEYGGRKSYDVGEGLGILVIKKSSNFRFAYSVHLIISSCTFQPREDFESSGDRGSCINVYSEKFSPDIVISDCIFHDSRMAILWRVQGSLSIIGSKFTNNENYRSWESLINVDHDWGYKYSKDLSLSVSIRDSYFYKNKFSNMIIVNKRMTELVEIRNNTFISNIGSLIGFEGYSWYNEKTVVTLEENRFECNANDGYLLSVDATKIEFSRNIVEGNMGNFEFSSSNISFSGNEFIRNIMYVDSEFADTLDGLVEISSDYGYNHEFCDNQFLENEYTYSNFGEVDEKSAEIYRSVLNIKSVEYSKNRMELRNNSFVNSKYLFEVSIGMFYSVTLPVDLRMNYWGTTDESSVKKKILDFYQLGTHQRSIWDPFLTKKNYDDIPEEKNCVVKNYCFGVPADSNFVCNGHGKCTDFLRDECTCDSGWYGTDCKYGDDYDDYEFDEWEDRTGRQVFLLDWFLFKVVCFFCFFLCIYLVLIFYCCWSMEKETKTWIDKELKNENMELDEMVRIN